MTRVLGIAVLATALAAPAWADVTIKQTTTGKGLGMSGDILIRHRVRPVRHEGRQIVHSAEPRRLFNGGQQLSHAVAIVAPLAICLLPASRGDGAENELALERFALVAIRPAMLQHQVHPLLQDRRRAVPEEGVLQDDDIVTHEQLLLALDVDVEVRISLVKIVKLHTLETSYGLHQCAVDLRFFERWMSKEDQNAARRQTLSPR